MIITAAMVLDANLFIAIVVVVMNINILLIIYSEVDSE